MLLRAGQLGNLRGASTACSCLGLGRAQQQGFRMASSTSKPIPPTLEGVANFRDLAWGHEQMQPGRVMRCAKPVAATAADVAVLLDEYGVRVMLDLRSNEEVGEDDPASLIFSRSAVQKYKRHWSGRSTALPSNPAATASTSSTEDDSVVIVRHHISLMERWRYYSGLVSHLPVKVAAQALFLRPLGWERSRAVLLREVNAGGLGMLYRILLDSARPEICSALNLVLQSLEERKPVLLFCVAGKDRTGLVSALVLTVAGCSEKEVIADYIKSDAIRKVALAGVENKPELRGLDFKAFEGSPAEAMREALDYLKQRHGSIEGYMSSIGFGPQQQQRLRTLLTTPDWKPKA